MKICIVGAGAVGGFLAGHLARGGHDVSVVARGAQLAAIGANGLTVRKDGGHFTVRCRAADDPAAFGPQDIVFITLKAHDIAAMLPRIGPLFADRTVLVPAINGIPWWYFHKEGGKLDGAPVRCLDPDGRLLAAVDPARVLGGVVQVAVHVPEPGVAEQTSATAAFILGEPDGSQSARVTAVSRAMSDAGLKTDVTPKIRDAIWTKLLGNIAFNPMSALVVADLADMFAQKPLVDLAARVVRETMEVAGSYGIRFAVTVEQRLEVARKLGKYKPSMLQDVERGRPMEVEAIVGTVVELGERAGVATPVVDTIYALLKARDRALRAADP
ncbi:MAG: 2-dehydropantoate 2-reductase [Alphaproteobacteria bacterium]|nr:2-dehydropantoate 2-reductase [Alphaproteobacteria bacterium]